MGLTVLDAGVVIGYLDPDDAHHAQCREAVFTRRRAGERLCMSAATYSETLVRPFRLGDESVSRVERLLRAAAVQLIPVDRSVAMAAARLRSSTRLRLPDAIVLATAEELGADEVLTTDARWPDVGLPVTVLAA